MSAAERSSHSHAEPKVVERYVIHDEIAAGGMATVHLGRLVGEGGFSRTVAIKRLHPQFAKDPEFVDMFLDEARLAARIRHPNVVSTLDVISKDGELLLVMDYVHGESLSRLARGAAARGQAVPVPIACGILSQALHGLHAAHEATSERGERLDIIHRDVSPQNIMVGVDGGARILDFGVAKAVMRASTTRDGQLKGKIAYMAPEQFGREAVDCRLDVFAAGTVFWEVLTGKRLFAGDDFAETMGRIAAGNVPPPSSIRGNIPAVLDRVVLKALAGEVKDRYASALEFAAGIEEAVTIATPREIGAWVIETAAEGLDERSSRLSEVETHSTVIPSAASASAQPAPESASQSVVVVPQSRKVLTLVAAALGGAVIVLLIVLLVLPDKKPEVESEPQRVGAAAAPVPPPATPEAMLTASAAPVPAGPSAAQATEAGTPEVASAAASASTAPEPSAPAARPAPQKPRQPSSPRTPKAKQTPRQKPKKPNCDPPYSIDPQGIKRIKPGCL